MNALAYVRSLRSASKRAYAVAYLAYMQHGGEEPGRGDLSYMAAQAVRLRLAAIRDGVKPEPWQQPVTWADWRIA
jgi:hypothetical protein